MHDTLVNQLLTKIDGVDSLNNILLIGMTNRKVRWPDLRCLRVLPFHGGEPPLACMEARLAHSSPKAMLGAAALEITYILNGTIFVWQIIQGDMVSYG